MTFFVQIHVDQFRTGYTTDALPRYQICMVFRNGDDDFIAFLQMRFRIASGNVIQAFRRITDENHFFAVLGIDQLAYGFTGIII